MTPRDLPSHVLERRAIVYVRQSTGAQVRENLESQRRQYELVDLARSYGFGDVRVIDDDLGKSASGTTERPGFRNLVGQICEGCVGAVFSLEASRLARNGRDWHHLLELCGLVGALVVDSDGIYDPAKADDRLLLGLKGTMSEFELTTMRARMLEATRAKARRGELRISVPVGYLWLHDTGLALDPDGRIQEAIASIFRLFERFGSARQVLIHMRKEGLSFPRPADGKQLGTVAWRAPVYRNIIAVLRNPFYAGAYVYGKTGVHTAIVDGVVRKAYGRAKPRDSWTVLLREHHEGYVTWEQFERTQDRLARNSFGKPAGHAKSGRGGRALMAGMLRCGRCGRMLHVSYGGSGTLARYSCRVGQMAHGLEPCIGFGAQRPDAVVAREVMLAVQPVAMEAAIMAERDASQQLEERRRALELEREQADYEVKLAVRRYEAVDPDKRLVAAELEARWNAALTRLRQCEARIEANEPHTPKLPTHEALFTLSADLERAWNAPSSDMRTKQRLVRALIEEIVVDVDDPSREVVLTIHWRGGQHSQLRVRKPRSGEHTRRTPKQAAAIMGDMATRWSDADIAATLNRMGLNTAQGKTWTAVRVRAYRRGAGIRGYRRALNDGRCLTMLEAARKLGVTPHVIRKLIGDGVLPARQIVADAPWQILATDLDRPAVQDALRRRSRRGRPCRNSRDDQTLEIPGT